MNANAKEHLKFDVLGVDFDALTARQAIDLITDLAANPNSPPVMVTQPHVEFLYHAARQPELRILLGKSWLNLANGVSVCWAAAYLHGGARSLKRFWITLGQIIFKPSALSWPLPERISSSNLTWPLLKTAAEMRLKVFLVGSPKTGDIRDTARFLQTSIDGIDIVGTYPGLITPAGEAGLVEQLEHLKPDLILVGMGFPLQEQLITRLMTRTSHGVFLGEGGTFDYEQFGGQRRRAPGLIQHIGLEWFWRLLLEPSRWRRMLAIPRFIGMVRRYSKNLLPKV